MYVILVKIEKHFKLVLSTGSVESNVAQLSEGGPLARVFAVFLLEVIKK